MRCPFIKLAFGRALLALLLPRARVDLVLLGDAHTARTAVDGQVPGCGAHDESWRFLWAGSGPAGGRLADEGPSTDAE